MIRTEAFEQVEITEAGALWRWLSRFHGQDASVWLVTWKAQHRDRYVSREEVLDALIAHGWIDGVRRKLDADRTIQLISPRRQQVWAQTYKNRAERLLAEGRMHPAGEAAIASAKSLELWDALEHVDALEMPDDLTEALQDAGAGAWFKAAAPSYRRNVLRWIAGAKRPETRANRIATVTSHAAEGRKVPNY